MFSGCRLFFSGSSLRSVCVCVCVCGVCVCVCVLVLLAASVSAFQPRTRRRGRRGLVHWIAASADYISQPL